jgi:hypothetical protein
MRLENLPPKSGPVPQGLNLSYNTVKDVKLTEKINGRQTNHFQTNQEKHLKFQVKKKYKNRL